MPSSDGVVRVPIAEAAVQLRLTREQVVRRIQRGELDGGIRRGRWYLTGAALEAAKTAVSEPEARSA